MVLPSEEPALGRTGQVAGLEAAAPGAVAAAVQLQAVPAVADGDVVVEQAAVVEAEEVGGGQWVVVEAVVR